MNEGEFHSLLCTVAVGVLLALARASLLPPFRPSFYPNIRHDTFGFCVRAREGERVGRGLLAPDLGKALFWASASDMV